MDKKKITEEFNTNGFVSFTPEIELLKEISNINHIIDEIVPAFNQKIIPDNFYLTGCSVSQRLENEVPQELKATNPLYGKRAILQAPFFPKELVRLIESDHLTEIAKLALETDEVVLHNGSLSAVYPGNTGNGTMFHTDTANFSNPRKAFKIIGSEQKLVNIMILLSDVDANLAPMKILQSTHDAKNHIAINNHISEKLNLPKNVINSTQENWIYEELLEDFKFNEISFEGKYGDIGLMNSNSFHKASENLTDNQSRRVLILNFARKQDKIFSRRYPLTPSKEFQQKFINTDLLELTFNRSASLSWHMIWKISDILDSFFSFIETQKNRILNPSVVISKIKYFIYSYLFSHKKNYLNLGGGIVFEHVNFIKLDVDSRIVTDSKKGVYNFDLIKDLPFPFEDNSIKGIYTSHCLEHLTLDQVTPIFKDSYRVLDKGSIIRVVLPDMAAMFDSYDQRDASYLKWLRDKQSNNGQLSVYDSWLRVVTRMFAGHVVDIFSDKELTEMYKKLSREDFVEKVLLTAESHPERWGPGSHKSAWTHKSLIKELKAAGFEDIYTSSRGKSKDPILRNLGKFDITMPNNSIFMEAIK